MKHAHIPHLAGKLVDPEQALAEPESSGLSIAIENPKVGLLHTVTRFIKQAINQKPENAPTIKEALEEVLQQDQQEEQLSAEEKTLLRNIITFSELTVGDIVIPRADIIAVPHDIGFEDLKKHITEARHTRIPVYQGNLDDIIGFIHIKDLIPFIGDPEKFSIDRIIHDMLFVPPSMRIVDLLLKMRLAGAHMAIVVDEYGGTDGLVTMEDLFEEIVGEIQDEHDEADEQLHVKWKSGRVAEVDARIPIGALEQALHINFGDDPDEEGYDTLGGMIFSFLGRIPAKGEVLDHPLGMKLEVLNADPRRIKRVRITLDKKHLSSQNG